MSRLEALALDELTEDQLAVLNAINSGPRGRGTPIGLVGPFGVWVRAPRIGMAVQALGGVARFALSARTTRQSLSSRRMPALPGLREWTRRHLKTFVWAGFRIWMDPSWSLGR